MGNGAPVPVGQRQHLYKTAERLVQEGHYLDNFRDYRNAVQTAIESDALDTLEVLIKRGTGNHKKLKPLHIACSLGKLESVELLVFAGFGAIQPNEDGRTPLHLCCLNPSHESALCATFLLLQSKKALSIFDSSGMSPLHLAVQSDNKYVTKVGKLRLIYVLYYTVLYNTKTLSRVTL